MVIRKGAEWGVQVERPDGLVVASSDSELARLIAGGSSGPFAVDGGDVNRTLGGVRGGEHMQRVDVDLLRLSVDGVETIAVAHAVAREPWWRGGPWRGRIVAVMNTEHHNRFDVAPRAHPNDGRADTLDVAAGMGVRQRVQAWRRLPHGTHLPHPAIATRQVRDAEWHFERPQVLVVDGRRHGRVRDLRVTVEPDAFQLHV